MNNHILTSQRMLSPGRPHHQYRRRDNALLVFYLFTQLLQQIDRLPYKPPVTLFTMGLMSLLYFTPEMFNLPHNLNDVAFNPFLIVRMKQYQRIWISALVHADAMHLYYNLSSFLYKGVALETLLGEKFAVLLVLLTTVSQLIFLFLSWSVAKLGWMPLAWGSFTVGFSGVIFGLKVFLNSLEENPAGLGFSQIFGLNLPWSKVVWMELILAQLLIPNASFLGHASGIIAGIVLLPVFYKMIRPGPWFDFHFFRRPRFFGSGQATHQATHQPRRDTDNSAGYHPRQSDFDYYIPAQEELRQRRVNRFS